MPPSRPPLPAWLIVGAPKCGTTTLAEWLRCHPGVFVSPRKELEFFDAHWDRGFGWYTEQFAGHGPDQLCGEATPGYWYSDAALDRIRQTTPDARLFILLREPVARLWSQVWFMQMLGVEFRSPTQAIARLLEHPDDDPGPGLVGLTPATRYTPRLHAVFERFPPGQVAVEFFDDLVRDQAALWERVCRHIGVDPGAAHPSDGESVNPTRVPRIAVLQRMLFVVGGSPGWSRLTGQRGAAVVRSALRWNAARPVPRLSPPLRARLRDAFRPDLEQLQALLGRAVPESWWAES